MICCATIGSFILRPTSIEATSSLNPSPSVMSASFASPPRHSQFSTHTVSQSTSPPSLTNTSSPTSSDSTGDEDAAALKSDTRPSASHRRARESGVTPTPSHPNSTNFDAYSPSIWGAHPQSIISGLDINNIESQQRAKLALDGMNFSGWDGNFSNLGATTNDADLSMDMDSTSSTDYGFSPRSIQSPASSHNAMPSFSGASHAMTNDSPSGSDSKTGSLSHNPASVSGTVSFAGSGDDSDGHPEAAWNGKTSDNDEAMFDSFVQSGSFGSPAVKHEAASFTANGSNGHAFASMNIPTNSSANMMPPSAPTAKPAASRATKASANASASASSSRRNSGESSEPKKSAGVVSAAQRRVGSQTAVHSNNLDADLGFSAFDVVRPNREGLKDLQVHIHGVPMHGAKSRVETQIRMRIELVRPRSVPAGGWERIGSFSHIKLPPLSGTKRKSKKYQKTDVPPEKTLFVDATVVNATPPHDRVYVCKGCRQRERKRAHRKKDPKTPLESQPPKKR